jgi:hypothetical protein
MSNGEFLNNRISDLVDSADCAGELFFIGGNATFQAKYATRYLPNFFPHNAAGDVNYWWSAT